VVCVIHVSPWVTEGALSAGGTLSAVNGRKAV
jgi:hypothetical protein